jgi:hypothetical protein
MRTASWVILCVVGVAILAISLISAGVAYSGDWPIGPTTLSRIEALAPGAGAALRGARGTAAAFGAAYGALWLTVVIGPYRRREAWTWWALLGAALVLAAVILARVPLVGTNLGVPTALGPLLLTLLGLVLDLGRLREAK